MATPDPFRPYDAADVTRQAERLRTAYRHAGLDVSVSVTRAGRLWELLLCPADGMPGTVRVVGTPSDAWHTLYHMATAVMILPRVDLPAVAPAETVRPAGTCTRCGMPVERWRSGWWSVGPDDKHSHYCPDGWHEHTVEPASS